MNEFGSPKVPKDSSVMNSTSITMLNAMSFAVCNNSQKSVAEFLESPNSFDKGVREQENGSYPVACIIDHELNCKTSNFSIVNDIEHLDSVQSFNQNDSGLHSRNFKISTQSIPCVPLERQEKELLNLGVSVYDQTDLENNIMNQVDEALKEEEETKRKYELERDLKVVSDDIRFVKQRLAHIDDILSMTPNEENTMTKEAKKQVVEIKREQDDKVKQLKKLQAKLKTLNACASGDTEEMAKSLHCDFQGDQDMDEETRYHLEKVLSVKETDEERLIRTGQMTPFGTVVSSVQHVPVAVNKIKIPDNEPTDFDKFLMEQVKNHQLKKIPKFKPHKAMPSSKNSEVFVDGTKFLGECSKKCNRTITSSAMPKVRKSAKMKLKLGSKYSSVVKSVKRKSQNLVENYKSDSDISSFETGDQDGDFSGSDKEYIPDCCLFDESDNETCNTTGKKKQKSEHCFTDDYIVNKYIPRKSEDLQGDNSDSDYKPKKSPRKKHTKIIDDGCPKTYLKRLKLLQKSELIQKQQRIVENNGIEPDTDDKKYVELEGEFKVPSFTWNKLYSYQQTGVRWLWELHQQNCGGIIGDEMGLGKTIQVIAFLIGLKTSNMQTCGDNFCGLGPVVLICPATVMHQWVKEFHIWSPHLRVAILHESGSFTGSKEILVHSVNKNRGVLITSYSGIVLHQQHILDCEWHYIILDEGHKIRNPNAQATLVVKQFRTQHRIILSGSPVQNNLKELWSLFDFVFPGKLGTLPVFLQQFSVPIVQGGYANASQVQVQTAYKCATVLRDTIKPYLLRRMKADVQTSLQLPNKSEQVLFCQLTEEQMQLYKNYLASPEIANIINGRLQIFVGLINLRKICNHPDIYTGGPKIFKDTDVNSLSEDMHYGYYKRSGKMNVVDALLSFWNKQGHRVLLFTQSRQMMEVLEKFVKSRGYTYMKMDGTTAISSRQPAIEKFNTDASIFVFLLTTRVGGIGVNLTGANRVIIYDPDWNPSTDTQARERAWRIGQEKQVTIYRLLTAGTIEEKIYHRQIFKQFVTNRVLKDPRQRRFFKSNDLYELFTFSELGNQGTETSAIFAGTGSEIKPLKRLKNKKNKLEATEIPVNAHVREIPRNKAGFSPRKMEKMKILAKKLSLEVSKKKLATVAIGDGPSLDMGNKNVCDKFSTDIANDSNYLGKKNNTSHSAHNTEDRKGLQEPGKQNISKQQSNKRLWKKKRKSIVVEGKKIDFLVKKDIFRASQLKEVDEANARQDDYVLSKLFKKSGVHTALKHDVIVDASDPDYMLVEGEANRVAKEAVKALKLSRRLCARAQEGIPSWTGLSGYCSSPQIYKPRFGTKKKVPVNVKSSSATSSLLTQENTSPSTSLLKTALIMGESKKGTDCNAGSSPVLSSSDLIAAIQQRKKIFASAEDEESDDNCSQIPVKESASEYDELLGEIRNFIAFQAKVDGQADTKELLEAFQDKLPFHQTSIFKALLGRICEFSRKANGEGVWFLKQEFR